MNYQERLQELLDRYLEENKELREKMNRSITLKALYEDLLSNLKEGYQAAKENKLGISFLFTAIYSDDIYLDEFYRILVNIEQSKESRQRFKKLYFDIEEDYKNLVKEMEITSRQIFNNRFRVSSASKAKKCFLHSIPITDDDSNRYIINNIKEIISYYETGGIITPQEELLLINEIEFYNRKIAADKASEKEQKYTDILYSEIPNILTAGFQPHDNIEINEDKKNIINKFVTEILKYISYLDEQDIIETIEKYHNYDLADNEYNYLVTKLLDHYFESILTLYKMLNDKEIYTRRSNRMDIIKAYYSELNIYLILLQYYNKITEYIPEEIDESDDSIVPEGTKNLIYSHSPGNFTKTKIISDMKDIPHEYYNKVLTLLNNFKNNDLTKGELKRLKSNKKFNSYLELRDDQVRIVLRHVKDNIYCIMGVSVKKSDNDINMYKTLVNRTIPDTSSGKMLDMELELALSTEKELSKMVSEKGRKGTR